MFTWIKCEQISFSVYKLKKRGEGAKCKEGKNKLQVGPKIADKKNIYSEIDFT